jgi:hypothetical protein
VDLRGAHAWPLSATCGAVWTEDHAADYGMRERNRAGGPLTTMTEANSSTRSTDVIERGGERYGRGRHA